MHIADENKFVVLSLKETLISLICDHEIDISGVAIENYNGIPLLFCSCYLKIAMKYAGYVINYCHGLIRSGEHEQNDKALIFGDGMTRACLLHIARHLKNISTSSLKNKSRW